MGLASEDLHLVWKVNYREEVCIYTQSTRFPTVLFSASTDLKNFPSHDNRILYNMDKEKIKNKEFANPRPEHWVPSALRMRDIIGQETIFYLMS